MDPAAEDKPDRPRSPGIRTVQKHVIAPIASGAFLIGTGILVFFTFRSFGWAIFMAVLLYTAFEKIYRRLHDMVRSRDLAAGLTLLLILVVVLGPLAALLVMLIDQAIDLVIYARSFIESEQVYLLAKSFPDLVDWITDRPFFWVHWLDRLFLILNEYSDVVDSLKMGEVVGGAYSYVLGGVGMSLTFLVNLSFGLILLYFLFREGDNFYGMVRNAMPFSHAMVDEFKDRFKEILQAILKGNILIAMLQGTLVGVGFWLFGIPNALLYGSIATFFSIIPVIGTAMVWGPGSVYLFFLKENPTAAVLLAIYGLTCYLILENIIKPRILDKKLGVHSVILFFAIIGGLAEFGITGVILGPLVLAIFVAIWRIYHIWEEGDESEDEGREADIPTVTHGLLHHGVSAAGEPGAPNQAGASNPPGPAEPMP